MRILCCYVLLLAVLTAPVSAQVGLAGEIGFTYKQDFARREGEASTRVNSTIKGASPFSLVRARFFVDAEVDDGVAVFTTLLFDEDLQSFDLEGAYVVFDEVAGVSWASALVGKMPTAFGTFAARSFAMVNPLIGVPLIYHYFTAIQGGSVARDNAAQLARRGDGLQPGRGLSILYDACWNSGVQLFGSYNQLTYALALTKGAVSNPTATDNDGILCPLLSPRPPRCHERSGRFHALWRGGQHSLNGSMGSIACSPTQSSNLKTTMAMATAMSKSWPTRRDSTRRSIRRRPSILTMASLGLPIGRCFAICRTRDKTCLSTLT